MRISYAVVETPDILHRKRTKRWIHIEVRDTHDENKEGCNRKKI